MKYDIAMKYKPQADIYDELFSADGMPRKVTETILSNLREIGDEEADRRRKRLNYTRYYQAIIKTQNEDEHGLDSIPLFLTAEEFETIKKGLKQRAKLYDLIAKDLYGEQKLIKDGIVPPALVYANPDFLQMLWTGKNSEHNFVNLMSCDIVRNAKGQFVAVNDKFQIPEGLGSTIENRLSSSRAYPELFHNLSVKRLNDFLEDFRHTILSSDDKRVAVLLASEPERNRRSEDAFLAKHLKLQLVENDDLTVRGFKVYLKTVTGLKKVDIILRRVEDGMCDPLELRIDSGEGAVGLISAVRSGNVKVLNALGTGVLESPIVRAFLQNAAHYFFKEDLIIKPVKTLWLGDEKAKTEALANPDKLMFYNAFNKNEYKIYKNLTMTGQLALIEKIMQNPEKYTAEEYVKTSTTPYFDGEKYITGEAHWRFFATNKEKDCSIMPGGYGWVVGADGKKAAEKDIWVLSDGKQKELHEKKYQTEPIALSRAGGDLPSRAADNLYKLGKNLEKAELYARIARGISKRLADDDYFEAPEQISFLLKSWLENYPNANEYEKILHNLVMKKTEDEGLQQICRDIRFLAVQLRDRLSEDTWQFIKSFGEHKLPEGKGAAALIPYLQRMVTDSAAFQGLISDGMTRGHGWRFLDLGKRLEHGIITLKLIKNLLKNKTDNEKSMLNALLEVGDGSLTYFRRYGTKLNAAAILDLLLCDESNPHSVAFHAMEIEKIVNELPLATENVFLAPLDREILRLTSALRLADVHALVKDENGRRATLSNYCDERIKEFENIGELLSREYLNHIPQKGIKTAMATEV